MVLAVCQYLPNVTLISTVLLFSDLPRTGQDPCLGWYNVHKMGSIYPICINRVSPDSLWCQESYTLMYNVLYAQNDYFWSLLVIFGYCVKNDDQGTTTLCGISRAWSMNILLLSSDILVRVVSRGIRYHLSRLSRFWQSYGDVTVVSVGVLNGLFDIGPLKWTKTWRTTHAACNEYKIQIYVDWCYSG
jgi:hypothetical protein